MPITPASGRRDRRIGSLRTDSENSLGYMSPCLLPTEKMTQRSRKTPYFTPTFSLGPPFRLLQFLKTKEGERAGLREKWDFADLCIETVRYKSNFSKY